MVSPEPTQQSRANVTCPAKHTETVVMTSSLHVIAATDAALIPTITSGLANVMSNAHHMTIAAQIMTIYV